MAISIAAAGAATGAGALASPSVNCCSSTKLSYLTSLQFPRELRRGRIGNYGLKSKKGSSRLLPLVFHFLYPKFEKGVFLNYFCLIFYVNFLWLSCVEICLLEFWLVEFDYLVWVLRWISFVFFVNYPFIWKKFASLASVLGILYATFPFSMASKC